MSRGSFDQALWPQAFLVRALKPAVCLHGPLPLGRSSLPFASRQMPKMIRGSFHPALRPLPSFVKGLQACCLPAVTPLPSVLRAFKPAVCQPSGHCFSYPGARRCRRPFRKSFRVLGFSRFSGFGVGKKMVKFEDAFWRSLLGVFWSIFGNFFIICWYCPRVKLL